MSLDNNQEKRRFHRILFNSEAILKANDQQYACKIIDLSLKGCLLELEQPLVEEQNFVYELTINLSPDSKIDMQLDLVHTIANQNGFKCKNIDLDSISQLRRLVELNLGDSELLERELAALSDYIFNETA